MTATQPCTAMVELDYQTAMSEGQRERPCGEPVAELCRYVYSHNGEACGGLNQGSVTLDDGEVVERLCSRGNHDWEPRLVHVSLGPCAFVERFDNESGHHEVVCGEEPDEDHPHEWSYVEHEHAPTVTELDVGHEAERATPPVEEVEA